jgi:conjugal transfer pilus assembly protein TraB
MTQMNINLKTRRTQLAVLVGILCIAGLTTAAVIKYGDESNKPQTTQNTPVPKLTGVVTATFDEQVNQSALAQQQAKTSALESKVDTLNAAFKQKMDDFTVQLQKKDDEIRRLTEQLTKPGAAARNGQTTGAQTPPVAPDGATAGPVAAGQADPRNIRSPLPRERKPPVALRQPGGRILSGWNGKSHNRGAGKTTFNYDSLKRNPPHCLGLLRVVF